LLLGQLLLNLGFVETLSIAIEIHGINEQNLRQAWRVTPDRIITLLL
jgi:hypothetical protein